MLDKLVETVAGKAGEQWTATLLAPAGTFWAILAALYFSGGSTAFWNSLSAKQEPVQLLLIAIAFTVVAASASIVQTWTSPVTRLLEGYGWPPIVCTIALRFQRFKYERAEQQYQSCAQHRDSSSEAKASYVAAEQALRRYPLDLADFLPTVFGNVMRASERRPLQRYGLDPNICWPHLWFVLPQGVKDDIASARSTLDATVRLWIWSALLVVCAAAIFIHTRSNIAALAVSLAAIAGCAYAYASAVNAASSFGALMEAAFDLFRRNLYEALNIEFPVLSAEEPLLGNAVTRYFYRGEAAPMEAFISRSAPPKPRVLP